MPLRVAGGHVCLALAAAAYGVKREERENDEPSRIVDCTEPERFHVGFRQQLEEFKAVPAAEYLRLNFTQPENPVL